MAKKLHESTEQTRNEDRLRLKGDKHGSRRRSRSRDREWDRRHHSRSRDRQAELCTLRVLYIWHDLCAAFSGSPCLGDM